MSELAALTKPIWVPLRALIVALVGAFLAHHWFQDEPLIPIIVAAVLLIMAYIFTFLGTHWITTKPVFALGLLEGWTLAPLTLAAVASGFAVVLAVHFAAPESATQENKQLLATISTSMAAFLSAAFVSWTSDQDASPAAERIRVTFQKHYVRVGQDPKGVKKCVRVQPESELELWIHAQAMGDVEGWGLRSRWERARNAARLLPGEKTRSEPTS